VIIREARPDEYAAVGELRVAAYRRLGLLPEDSGYAETLRAFGFADDCVVLVAASEAGSGSGILGTITLEPFGPHNELAQDETEADIRAFAVAPQAQGQGVGRNLLLAAIECAGNRGVCRLRLCTQSAMKAAQHLYIRTGFSRTPDLDFEPVPGITLQAYELALPSNPFPGQQPDQQPKSLSPGPARRLATACQLPERGGWRQPGGVMSCWCNAREGIMA
jgi:ribosomal protein S18 acetylase RimI-like enzyme